MKRIKAVSQNYYNIAKEDGWDEFECCHGYGIFDGEYPTNFGMIEGQHIERIDIMECWDSDISAAEHAERHEGIKIIRDIKGLYEVFIDTPENRKLIMEQLKEENDFEKFCEEIEEIRGAAVYGDIDEEPNVELAMITGENIKKATEIIEKYGYKITEEGECEGSDYPSYCIWFEKDAEDDNRFEMPWDYGLHFE